jgi:hypothetical protein
VGPLPKSDILATTSIRFLTNIVGKAMHVGLFSAEGTLHQIVQVSHVSVLPCRGAVLYTDLSRSVNRQSLCPTCNSAPVTRNYSRTTRRTIFRYLVQAWVSLFDFTRLTRRN